ncbi:MerR family transcriptional regulator [Catellatospora sp. TT07R-123]|uniref:HEAT repeat domain-containing protein n=1 Tax=Catellatospora sp. TT07R-123 TaxID=2733863 RepID=UPI001B03F669|nr:MerR family transcriptional regulator [Catellatospora sp. TT07R-123]GHJ47413.1 MerR family transcriptional regulator [Catellatospora sp. TT07R-123]
MLIGEVAEQSGISARMLRHYDRIGLASPTGRTHGGYRQYSPDDVRRLFHVEGLRTLGLSLQEIADVLADLSFSPASMVEQLVARTHERLAREQELLHRLGQVRASDPAAWSDVLRTIGLMRGLDTGSPSARQRLVLALGEQDERDTTLLAETALNEADANVAGALQWALARKGEGAIPVLAEALDSPDPERRHRALAALAKIDSPRAVAVLADAYRHPDPLVSARGTLARGRRGTADTIPALVALVVNGPDDVEAAEVLAVLAAGHGQEEAVARAIAAELATAADPARLRLTAALAEVPGPLARATLTGLLDDRDKRVALTATFVLRTRPPEL